HPRTTPGASVSYLVSQRPVPVRTAPPRTREGRGPDSSLKAPLQAGARGRSVGGCSVHANAVTEEGLPRGGIATMGHPLWCEIVSNCLESQAICGSQRRWCRTIALRMVSSFRMQAVM